MSANFIVIRFVRLGTASMLSQQDGPFINLARLNVGKYSKRPNIAKALFEYIFYHENSMREAMELASQVNKLFRPISRVF